MTNIWRARRLPVKKEGNAMTLEPIAGPGPAVVLVRSDERVITDPQSALDLAMSAKYTAGADRIAIDKGLIAEDFFILSTGLAGEILQKFINYHVKIAIYGDYSRYTSKPLKDFIYESNQGSDVFFTATEDEAIRRLREAK